MFLCKTSQIARIEVLSVFFICVLFAVLRRGDSFQLSENL